MRVFLATFLLGLAAASQLPSGTINLSESNSFRASQYVNYPWQSRNYLSTRDLFEGPIFVVAPSSQHPSQLTFHYLHNGLKSASSNQAFGTLHQYMKSGDLSGTIFFPREFYNARFFDTFVDSLILPDNFKVGDFLNRLLAGPQIPVIYIDSKAQIESYNFNAINPLLNVGVYDEVIEPIRPDV